MEKNTLQIDWFMILLLMELANTNQESKGRAFMNLNEVKLEEEYIIKEIQTEDEELNAFLFSLGCYSGESITVISRRRKACVVAIKDGRYNIDSGLAGAILVEPGK